MNCEQITSRHRSRLALVYIRQSSRKQVEHHKESQRRQRDFVERAEQLGWLRDQIQVMDEDLAKTASRSGQRSGFEQMAAMTALGKVGIILALEVDRLARGNRDWYHLLDICGITGALIADVELIGKQITTPLLFFFQNPAPPQSCGHDVHSSGYQLQLAVRG